MTRLPMRKMSKKRQAELGNWNAVKAIVRRRDADCVARNNQEKCWGPLDVHHRLPRSRGGKDVPMNLLLLCGFHHRQVHENPDWARERGLLR